MDRIKKHSVDLILSDLPYGRTDCKWDHVIPFAPLWEQYKRVLKPSGAVVLTAVQPFTTDLINSNREWYKYSWVWVKTNCTGFANAKKQPLRCYEDVCVFYQRQPTYHPQGVTRLKSKRSRKKNTGDFIHSAFRDGYVQEFTNYPKNVLTFASERNTIHPTQKPVALFDYLVRTYTNPGDRVLDNCVGSGTTAIACINAEQCFCGFESDGKIYQKAIKRIEHRVKSAST